MSSLTAKQERFVREYLIDMNVTAPAARSGYSKKTARAIGCENLANLTFRRRSRRRRTQHQTVQKSRLTRCSNVCVRLTSATETKLMLFKAGPPWISSMAVEESSADKTLPYRGCSACICRKPKTMFPNGNASVQNP